MNSRIILQMSRSTTTVFEAVQKPHSMSFGVETLDYASLMNVLYPVKHGEQGWRNGDSTLLPPMCPGFDSRTRRHLWIEFVVGSRPCSEGFFSGFSGFPPSSLLKNQHFKISIRLGVRGPLVYQLKNCCVSP